jgi:hypothetical protein
MADKEWDFGFGQVKVFIDGETLKFKQTMVGEKSFPLGSTKVSVSKELMTMEISFLVSGVSKETIKVPKSKKTIIMADEIEKYVNEYQSNHVKNSQSNDLDQLEKLQDLKTKGIITEEEFSAKKKQILGL